MKVFKFGGASVKDADAVRNVADILRRYQSGSLLIVVSAMGKMTNALENVLNALLRKTPEAQEALDKVIRFHQDIARDLFPTGHGIHQELLDTLSSIPRIVDEHQERHFDVVYDQVVSLGERLSTRIVSAYLDAHGLPTHYLDARDCILTDNSYREGQVDWTETKQRVAKETAPLFDSKPFVLTQGFIGRTAEGLTVTLGREGSDYTAAIFSYCLDAEAMYVWKDVPGILNADPRKFSNVTKLDRISYKEAIEMTYYGAKVIHPKTIKPLQNKGIPLWVKSFVAPEGEGTIISAMEEGNYPPIVVLEPSQTLLHISTRDFSFVAEHHLSHLFASFARHRIKVNMMRNTAISFSVCVTHREERLARLLAELDAEFKVDCHKGLELITVRYYNKEVIEKLKSGKIVLLEERIKNTMQMVVKSIAIPERVA
jgi:aspartate kinase